MQDYRNGNGSHGNRLYLHEECTNRKNLYRSGLGMPPVILLPSSEKDFKKRRITGRCRKWNNMMDKVEKKRQKEQYVVEEMIRLYCRKKHPKEKRQEGQMCPDCQETFGLCKTKK